MTTSSPGSAGTSRKRSALFLLAVLVAGACSSDDAGSRATATPAATRAESPASEPEFEEFDVPSGAHPHDVAPARDGGVWYTAQGAGALGHLDPRTGRTKHIALVDTSKPGIR